VQQPVNPVHLICRHPGAQRRQIIFVQVHIHSPKLSIGCFGRAGFAAGSGCG
jgi:hypothetical protein